MFDNFENRLIIFFMYFVFCFQQFFNELLSILLDRQYIGLDASFKSPSNRKPKKLIVVQQTSNEVKHNPALDQMKSERIKGGDIALKQKHFIFLPKKQLKKTD